jgi:RimJ/RimL family protein N-acetyltransferase
MIDISASDPKLEQLFDPYHPNSPALWAVLKGHYPGKALVDQADHPTQCVLRTDAILTYFSSRVQQSFLNEAITTIREQEPIWLVWPHDTSLHPPVIKYAQTVERLEFCETNPDILMKLRKQLPKECIIKEIDDHLLERCLWRSEMEFYAGSRSNFLKYGIGYCLLKEDEIVVEAYASSLGKDRAEIGAITQEAYRGQGYAPVACAFLIDECGQRGYQSYWSCDAEHTASIRLAQKLGFQHKRAYQIFEYDSLL